MPPQTEPAGNSEATTEPIPERIAGLIRTLRTSRNHAALTQAAHQLGELDSGSPEAIQTLIQVARSTRDEPTRWAVIESLSRIAVGDSLTISVLIELLPHSRIPTQRVISHCLSRIARHTPTAIPTLIERVRNSADPHTQQAVAIILGRIGAGDDRAITALIELVYESGDYDTRMQVIRSLRHLKATGPEVIDAYLHVIRNGEDYYIRYPAVEGLTEIASGDPKAISALTDMANQTGGLDPAGRKLAAMGLKQISPPNPDLDETLLHLFRSPDLEDQLAAVSSLGALSETTSPELIEVLAELLQTSQDRRLRQALIHCLQKSVTPIPALIEAVRHQLQVSSVPQERYQLAMVLGEWSAATADTTQIVIDTLKHKSTLSTDAGPCRSLAFQALIKIGKTDPNAITALLQLLRREPSDPDLNDHRELLMALGSLADSTPDSTKQLVIQALLVWTQCCLDPLQCALAMRSLSLLGLSSPEAIQALETLAQNHPDDEVQQIAHQYLGQASP